MSNKSKGAYFEKKSEAYMKKIGAAFVERARAQTVWIFKGGRRIPISLSHDFFGLWDMCCVFGDGSVHWVQVKQHDENLNGHSPSLGTSRKRRLMADFPGLHNYIHLWVRKKGKREYELKVSEAAAYGGCF